MEKTESCQASIDSISKTNLSLYTKRAFLCVCVVCVILCV